MESGKRGSYFSYEESGSAVQKYGPRKRKRKNKCLAETIDENTPFMEDENLNITTPTEVNFINFNF